jgi:hypothetical protein
MHIESIVLLERDYEVWNEELVFNKLTYKIHS